MRFLNTKCLSLLSAIFFSGILLADFTENKRFDIDAGGSLNLNTEVGAIEVHTHASNSVEIRVTVQGFEKDEFILGFDKSGKTITVTGEKEGAFSSWGRNRVNFDILVPKEFNLFLNTSGGSIRVDDLTGKVDVSTSGGSLRFGNITGNIDGHTSGGSITVEGAKGDVKVRTSGGSLRLGDIEGDLHGRTSGGSISLGKVTGDANIATSGGSIRINDAGGRVMAKTSGGSIEVTFTRQPTGDSEIATSAGSITAYLNDNVAVDLDARGMKVKSDFEVNGETQARYKLKGPINGGGPELELQTSAGSVYIRRQ